MGAGVRGEGDNLEVNGCGINKSHLYSMLAIFTLKSDTVNEKVVLMRNPWGT